MAFSKKILIPVSIAIILSVGFFWYFLIYNSAAAKLARQVNQAQEIKNKYQLESASLVLPAKDKNSIEVKIGESNAKEFTPNLEISRWEGEVKMKIKPDVSAVSAKDQTLNFDGNKVIFSTPKADYRFYDIPASNEHPEGAYEYEVILKEKPATNIVSLDIETKNLDFFYQPELTQKQKERGMRQPENAVGSYAAYYKDRKSGDFSKMGGKNYKAGKAFHIYRPQIIDATGNKVWGKLNINEKSGLMTVTMPQDFLDKGVYPIVIDPTFGYTTIGEGAAVPLVYDGIEFRPGNYYTSPANATLNSITAYIAGGMAYDSYSEWEISVEWNEGASVVRNDGSFYYCILDHTSTADDEPGVGVNWETYWELYTGLEDWALSTEYIADDDVVNDEVIYSCILDHTSTADDEPGVGANWETYWRILFVKEGFFDAKVFVNQRDSEGSGTHAQIATAERTDIPVDEAWRTFTLNNESILASTDYILNIVGRAEEVLNSSAIFGDLIILDGSNNSLYVDFEASYASPASPWVIDLYDPYAGEDWALSTEYIADDEVVNDYEVYTCILDHTSTADDEPGVGVNWETYWDHSGPANSLQTSIYATYTAAPSCGDGVCNGDETHATCPADCPLTANSAGSTIINTPLSGRFIDSSLVGYWSFDGADMGVTTATDLSGNGNTGTLNGGVKKVPGINGQALSFDGVDDYVEMSSELVGTGADSFCAWIYPRSWGTPGYSSVISNLKFQANIIDAGDYLEFTSDNNSVKNSAYNAISLNTWQHVCAVRDAAGLATIYVNGQVSGTPNQNSGTPTSGAANLRIGRGAAYFPGLIDEVRIYNRALSASEIAEQYRAGSARLKVNTPVTNYLTSGLVGNWTFNGQDISGATAYDRSGNNKNGTISGATPAIGKIGQALQFNGTSAYVDAGNVSAGVKTIAFWVKADGTTDTTYFKGKLDEVRMYSQALSANEISQLYKLGAKTIKFGGGGAVSALASARPTSKILDLNGTANIEVATGIITANGFTGATIYVDGSVGSTIDNNWRFVAVTTDTSLNASAVALGKVQAAWACEDTVTFTYRGASVTYGTVASANSTCWLDRNLGASGVAASATDSAAYGDLFQWGREDDGHQATSSNTVEGDMTLTSQPGHANFITELSSPNDWANSTWITRWTVADDDPCPSGWRVPTNTEWDTERLSWSPNNNAAGAFASPLKLTMAGYRRYNDALLSTVDSAGRYWSSTATGNHAYYLYFHSGAAIMNDHDRADAYSVRCLKD